MTSRNALEANLRAYAVHQRAVGALFWLPTVFLYLIDEVGLTGALQLGALYYFTVVVLEVPSGWFSDRVGRVAEGARDLPCISLVSPLCLPCISLPSG